MHLVMCDPKCWQQGCHTYSPQYAVHAIQFGAAAAAAAVEVFSGQQQLHKLHRHIMHSVITADGASSCCRLYQAPVMTADQHELLDFLGLH